MHTKYKEHSMVKYDDLNSETMKNWEYLLENFQPEQIAKWDSYDQYVVGKGRDNKSFCYLVEAGTKELGEIRGANSSKFGMWYGKFGEDKTKDYRATKQHFNGDVNNAFKQIKNALINLINEAKQLTEYKEIKSILSDMFKRKIVYLYNKECMIPSFVPEDLYYFEKCLNLEISDSFEAVQKELLKYKHEHHSEFSNHDFGWWLYSNFGRNKMKEEKKADEDADDELNKVIGKIKAPEEEYETRPVNKVDLKKAKDGIYFYPRDPKMAAIALKQANYKCECNHHHELFIRKSNGTPYTEVII